MITRRKTAALEPLEREGFRVGADNKKAVRESGVVILAVTPKQMPALIKEIAPVLELARHTVISVASGVSIEEIKKLAGKSIAVVRAMPNTAVAIGESMTCLSAHETTPQKTLDTAAALFGGVGKTLVIEEDQMVPATALCACGIAFFLRAIRAASQGGIQISFHASEALMMAAQTAKGAAALLLSSANHPETEIDKVTTPQGCTIAGLNQMEHEGFGSALIKGIVVSAEKAASLYKNNK